MKKILGAVTIAVLTLFVAAEANASVSHQVSKSEADAAERFWTPERIGAAIKRDPMFGRVDMSDGSELRHRPVTVYRPEVGKILGWDRIGAYSCSGSVIETASLRLVLTAGHCLYYRGSWARRILFIPDFKDGRKPFGVYKAKAIWVPGRWMRRATEMGAHYDLGLIVTRKAWNGSRIGENVGALPVQTYPVRTGVTDIYGYPGAGMKGRFKRTCRSRTYPWTGGWFMSGPTGLLARCNMAPGSSGGPWVSRYKRKNGGSMGVVDGLTSTGGKIGRKSFLTSPYFGKALVNLIRATEGG